MASRLQRKCRLKMLTDDGRTTDGRTTDTFIYYNGAPVIFSGGAVNFSGAPVLVMTLWQYRRTGIPLIYHPIRRRLVSHSIQVNLVMCKRTMKSHHFILSIIAVLIVVYFIYLYRV